MLRIRPNTRWALLAGVPLALAVQGCTLEVLGPSPDRDDLREAQALWERQGVSSYRYTVRRSCFCGGPEVLGPVRVEVRGGQTVSVTHLVSGTAVRAGAFDGLDTVEDLFAAVRAALDSDPDELTARYDPVRGHPVRLYADYDVRVADEENGFTVEDFEPVAQAAPGL